MNNVNNTGEIVAVKFKTTNFVSTPYIRDLSQKIIRYLNAGFPVHLKGPAGTGKTTLAMHVASYYNTPSIMIHGNDEFRPSDLVGSNSGYRRERWAG